jgi:hypothetical protein
MSKKANFTERNRELILKIDKVTSEGLKASVSLADLMPSYSKKRIILLTSVYAN